MTVSSTTVPTVAPAATATGRVLPVAVTGVGAYLPERVVTNDELARTLDTDDEWIRTRTGIRQRHHAAAHEATADLAAEAGRRALADAGVAVEDLGAVIVATTTPDHRVPGTAPLVGARLGTTAPAFDLNAACSGFVYGLQVGGSLTLTGSGPVLLIGAETLSRVVDPGDRTIAVLFGDGAGAAVLEADEGGAIGPFDLGADGTDPSVLWCETGGTRVPSTPQTLAAGTDYLTMRGREVYRFAVARMTASSQTVLAAAGVDVAEVDLVVGHQANARILSAVADRLGVDPDHLHVTVDRHANTSAASIPLALADALRAGRLAPGDRVLLTAFGAGLTWGSTLLTWTR